MLLLPLGERSGARNREKGRGLQFGIKVDDNTENFTVRNSVSSFLWLVMQQNASFFQQEIKIFNYLSSIYVDEIYALRFQYGLALSAAFFSFFKEKFY